jgi:hypothetical protein
MVIYLVPVIVARVKKAFTPDGMSRVYKVKIKREFKVSLTVSRVKVC